MGAGRTAGGRGPRALPRLDLGPSETRTGSRARRAGHDSCEQRLARRCRARLHVQEAPRRRTPPRGSRGARRPRARGRPGGRSAEAVAGRAASRLTRVDDAPPRARGLRIATELSRPLAARSTSRAAWPPRPASSWYSVPVAGRGASARTRPGRRAGRSARTRRARRAPRATAPPASGRTYEHAPRTRRTNASRSRHTAGSRPRRPCRRARSLPGGEVEREQAARRASRRERAAAGTGPEVDVERPAPLGAPAPPRPAVAGRVISR